MRLWLWETIQGTIPRKSIFGDGTEKASHHGCLGTFCLCHVSEVQLVETTMPIRKCSSLKARPPINVHPSKSCCKAPRLREASLIAGEESLTGTDSNKCTGAPAHEVHPAHLAQAQASSSVDCVSVFWSSPSIYRLKHFMTSESVGNIPLMRNGYVPMVRVCQMACLATHTL